jgi:predicted DNA-binding protein (UPF0251 family)
MTTRHFTDEELDAMTLEDAESYLSTAVYMAAGLIERLEGRKKVWGNGHHARQKIAQAAVEDLRSRWREEKL